MTPEHRDDCWGGGNTEKHLLSLSQAPESLEGASRRAEPPLVGQVVLLGCRRSGELAPGRPAQGCCWGPPGTRQNTWGPEHPYSTQGWGRSLAMALSSSRHGPQPTLRQPIPAAGKMQLGCCRASLHWLSWAACPATHSGHIPSPWHVSSCPSAPSAPAFEESSPGDRDGRGACGDA